MEEFAKNIFNIISGYRNEDGIHISIDDIIIWGQQFGEDGEFILCELSQIIPKVYLSREKAKECVWIHIKLMLQELRYDNISKFLMDTEFLDIQAKNKSQKAILIIIEEVLNDKYNESYKAYASYPKHNFIYFDDVLATGGTISRELTKWLNKIDNGIKNVDRLLNGSLKLLVHFFCWHSWGLAFQKFKLKKTFEDSIDKKIKWFKNLEIQNHIKWNNQALNIAIPVYEQPANVQAYLANLNAKNYEDYAYRKDTLPKKETFFTSKENRVKYESLILQKGLEIINMIQGEMRPNIRPLGIIHPNYKTFGLGTHFFTWRNIPNNCPLVFWWEVEGHNWKPLFPVVNRG